MTTRTIHVSDLSGESDAETELIGLGHEWHEVDLTETERDELHAVLEPYLKAGRRCSMTAGRRLVPETTVAEREEIRAWARDNGYELADFGRIPKRVFAAYRDAHDQAA